MIGYVILGEEEAKKWYNGYMNSKEAAEYLGISRYMIRKLVKENKIPYTENYKNVSFHKTILDAWMRGEFIPGRVELILDGEKIDYDHRDAIREHYKRYPELLEIAATKEEIPGVQINSDYQFEVRHDGVLIRSELSRNAIEFQVFLSNTAIDQLIQLVLNNRSGQS
jgi:excisionase family DNA binding protein